MAKYSAINGSCTFEKRSFTSNQSDKQLTIDDPNFWAKILKDSESATSKLVTNVKSMTDFKNL